MTAVDPERYFLGYLLPPEASVAASVTSSDEVVRVEWLEYLALHRNSDLGTALIARGEDGDRALACLQDAVDELNTNNERIRVEYGPTAGARLGDLSVVFVALFDNDDQATDTVHSVSAFMAQMLIPSGGYRQAFDVADGLFKKGK